MLKIVLCCCCCFSKMHLLLSAGADLPSMLNKNVYAAKLKNLPFSEGEGAGHSACPGCDGASDRCDTCLLPPEPAFFLCSGICPSQHCHQGALCTSQFLLNQPSQMCWCSNSRIANWVGLALSEWVALPVLQSTAKSYLPPFALTVERPVRLHTLIEHSLSDALSSLRHDP